MLSKNWPQGVKDPNHLSSTQSNRLLEVVRVYDRDGRVEIPTFAFFMHVKPPYRASTADPPADIETGFAILFESGGALHAEFHIDWDKLPDVTEGLRMRGPAIRIALRDNEFGNTDYSLSSLRPMFFQAFRALRRFFDVFRLSRFQANPVLPTSEDSDVGSWLDFPLSETFPEFLRSSYATLEVDGSRVVEASLLRQMFGWGQEESEALRESVSQSLNSDLPRGRMLLLDAWVALYEGNLLSAISLANTALEVEVRDTLLQKLQHVYPDKTGRQLDKLLKDLSFPVVRNTLLPLVGVKVTLTKELDKACERLRKARNSGLHKGEGSGMADWQEAKRLLMSAEKIFQDLTAQTRPEPDAARSAPTATPPPSGTPATL